MSDDEQPLSVREFCALPGIDGIITSPRVAVAVSGGQDSMALLFLLAQVRGGAPIDALTVDHGLRAESRVEAENVAAQVKEWPGVRHSILPLSLLNGPRLMERARDARHAVLADYCRGENIAHILFAHHLDDQAETMLFRLAKGSGLDGLGGMQPSRSIDGLILLRPLLDVPKARLIATCHAHGITVADDPSNSDPAYARARLRAASPALEREGLSAKRLAVTAARLRRARDALDYYADTLFETTRRPDDGDILVFDHAKLAEAPPEIRLRVLQRAFGVRPVRREKLEQLAEDVFADVPFRRRTLGGFVVSLHGGRLVLTPEVQSAPCPLGQRA